MKKGTKKLLTALLLVLMLIPVYQEADDGGSRCWNAVLWGVEKIHSMRQEEDVKGYLTGTRMRIFWFEVYNDAVFAPGQWE